jgi:hypothetical protein
VGVLGVLQIAKRALCFSLSHVATTRTSLLSINSFDVADSIELKIATPICVRIVMINTATEGSTRRDPQQRKLLVDLQLSIPCKGLAQAI